MTDAPVEKKIRATGLSTLPKMTNPGHHHKYEIRNAVFKNEDQAFIAACNKVDVKPTTRQASKWRNGRGKAFLEGRF
jgi:hypothetical protein